MNPNEQRKEKIKAQFLFWNIFRMRFTNFFLKDFLKDVVPQVPLFVISWLRVPYLWLLNWDFLVTIWYYTDTEKSQMLKYCICVSQFSPDARDKYGTWRTVSFKKKVNEPHFNFFFQTWIEYWNYLKKKSITNGLILKKAQFLSCFNLDYWCSWEAWFTAQKWKIDTKQHFEH